MNHKHLHKEDMQEICIQFLLSELRYDIDFASNRLARVITSDNNGKNNKRSTDFTTEGEDNDDTILRLINQALTQLRHRTSFASGDRGSRMATNEITDYAEDYHLNFHLPKNWRGNASVLTSLCHEYIKDYTLSQWFILVSHDSSNTFTVQADGVLSDIVYELRKEPAKANFYSLTDA